MKRKLDLTVDRLFSAPKVLTDLELRRKFRNIGFLYSHKTVSPWDFIKSDIDCKNYDRTFLTGNKKQRLIKKRNILYKNCEFCERCGKKMKFYYDKKIRLCSKCNEILKNGYENKSIINQWFLELKNKKKRGISLDELIIGQWQDI